MSWTLFIQVLILIVVGTCALALLIGTFTERKNKW